MQLFEHKNSNKMSIVNNNDPVRPYNLDKRLPFSRPFLYTLLVLLVVFIIPIALVQSAPIEFTQGEWIVVVPNSLATEPFAGWIEYRTNDAGVVGGANISLQRVNYTMIQTSDDGVADTCVATGCSTAGGFNAGVSTPTNTTVYDVGAAAYIGLSTTAADGNLVTLFGPSGIVRSNPGTGSANETIRGIAVDGTYIYAAGYDVSLGSSNAQWRIEKRDKTNGILDSGFGTNGVVLSNPGNAISTSIAIDGTYMYVAGSDASLGNGQWRFSIRHCGSKEVLSIPAA